MIKVDVAQVSEGVVRLTFESNRPDDPSEQDKLDIILKALLTSAPKRGAFVPEGQLHVDVAQMQQEN